MEGKAVVAISDGFFDAFAQLPKSIQGKVSEFVNKFRNDPTAPGINYEKIDGFLDKKICSARINDEYRAIIVRQQKTGVYLLLWADHHDEAYAWAKKKRCEVNPQTGVIQIWTVEDTPLVPRPAQDFMLFAEIPDKDLMNLGVPEELIPFVRSIKTAEEFFAKKQSIPLDAYENLQYLATDNTLDDVYDMIAKEKLERKVTGSFADALDVPDTLKSFVVISGEDELRRMMEEPLEKWRVFLHPTQRKIVNMNYSGPARVLGGAGTGKTVVAIQRAKHLAAAIKGKERILFTTFTANLASDIKDNLLKICSAEEYTKIDVIHLDAWVAQYLHEHGYSAEIIYDKQLKKLWEEVVATEDIKGSFPVSFYEEEYNRVVAAQGAFSCEKYCDASRVGRGTSLNRKKRIQIWAVFEHYMNLMKERQVRDINTAMYECCLLLQKETSSSWYRHVIVDEAQDLSANGFRLLRAIAGEEHENDLFIVGDAHQRIYKNKAILSQCGINVKGRSSILRINYRTTEEIRKAAFALLNGIKFDDLDDSFDAGDRCRSLTNGKAPQILSFANANEELDALVKEINRLKDNGVSEKSICVVARTGELVGQYKALLSSNNIRCYEIKGSKTDDQEMDGIRIATMHRVKGLEFQYIFVVAANQNIIPFQKAIDRTDIVSERETMTAEKCLLYVALTRAQKGEYISGYGQMSEFLVK